jgi:hypothetical protein
VRLFCKASPGGRRLIESFLFKPDMEVMRFHRRTTKKGVFSGKTSFPA